MDFATTKKQKKLQKKGHPGVASFGLPLFLARPQAERLPFLCSDFNTFHDDDEKRF